MRSICSAIVLLSLIPLLPVARAADEDEAAPALRLEEESWSFETVTAGEKPEHTFVVENTGGAPLTISRVLHSCGGCFEVELGAKELEPGEKTDMKLVVLTARRRGKFRKYLYIESNDPTLSRKRITITGTIKPRDDSASGTDVDAETGSRAETDESPTIGP